MSTEELDKYLEVQDKFDAIVAFVEWINGHGMCVAQNSAFARPGHSFPMHLVPFNPAQFACAFYGIDYEKLYEQKLKSHGG